MNERIRELALQAGIVNRKFSFGQWWETDLTPEQKNFAELIVRECVDKCEKVAADADQTAKSAFLTGVGHMLHEGMWGGAKNCAASIKKHFGVEE